MFDLYSTFLVYETAASHSKTHDVDRDLRHVIGQDVPLDQSHAYKIKVRF